MESARSAALRARVFDLVSAAYPTGSLVDRQTLLDFSVDGESLPLIDYSRGIRNPRQLEATLSIVSSASGPYGDETIAPGIWRYDFRTGGPGGDNAKLIEAHRLMVPIMMFRKLRPNLYQAVYPVRIVQVRRDEGDVVVALDDLAEVADHIPSAVEKRYATIIAKRRVHQPAFRAMVLRAYENRCTVCRFAHVELLDAAHIVPDSRDHGDADVTNGLTMCKIHHGAYDQNFLGITPDYEIRINADLLREKDGPMLTHGLQEMHRQAITLPTLRSERPRREHLAERFAEFTRG